MSVLPDDGRAPSTLEREQETAEEGPMLSQTQVRGLVRSRFWTGFVCGLATAVCTSWLKWLLSTVL
jgi:hypothetical protein